MDLKSIHIFVHIVQENGFSAAGHKIGLSKQTISRKLPQLEQGLGIRLLERSTRNIRLTEQGKQFYQYAIQISALTKKIEEDIKSTKSEPSGKLHISAPVALGETFVQKIISEYITRYPKVNVTAKFTFKAIVPMKDDIDVAFRIGPPSNTSIFAKKIIPSSEVVCVASATYINKCGPFYRPQDLMNQHGLFLKDHYWKESRSLVFHKEIKSQTITVVPKISTNSISLIKEMLLRGVGFACLPMFICQQEIKKHSLEIILPKWKIEQQDVFAVYPSRKLMSATIRSFLNLLDEFRVGGKNQLKLEQYSHTSQ